MKQSTRRAIKFRAWSEKRGMGNPSMQRDFISSASANGYHFDEKATWTQFTGLHDKNWKEIYEDDVWSA